MALFRSSQFSLLHRVGTQVFIGVLLALSLFIAIPRGADAVQATLAWTANQEGDLAGYKVYYGNQSGKYTANLDVGNVTTYTVANLPDGNYYYFALTAYNTGGSESGFSQEVSTNPLSANASAANASAAGLRTPVRAAEAAAAAALS